MQEWASAGAAAEAAAGLRIAIVTDAWRPQVNGVVRTISNVARELEAGGDRLRIVSPEEFASIPCPSYAEIRLALRPRGKLSALLDDFDPERIHIATEGPLGLAARRYCRERRLSFTTSFHTRFPEYVEARWSVPARYSYAFIRWFHRASSAVMVATETLRQELARRGLERLVRWTRGVDTDLFRPLVRDLLDLPRPVFLYVGRLAVEKNVESFLALDLPGTKLVVGDGPRAERLRRAFPQTVFLGPLVGEALVRAYASADVLVFPSRTDTFGNVMLEALACGVPVAGYPVPGPLDVLEGSDVGVLDEDLRRAALSALEIPRERCRELALERSWARSAAQFRGNLRPVV